MINRKLLIVLSLIASILLTSCGYELSDNKNSRTYDCDYHTFSLNTVISTTVDNKEVEISGNILTFIEDPLVMTDSNNNVIAKADDSYKLIGQDDHAIMVNNKFEIAIHGNFEVFGNSYDLHNEKGEKVGYAEFNQFNTSGAIYDSKDNIIATFDRTPLFNDYTVTIADNNLCSDTGILMLIASYVSDYHADSNN